MTTAIASLGIGIDEAYAGRGLATELAARVLAFRFEDLRLHRIEADVAVENAACIKLLERIGTTREGVARECIFTPGRWWTEARYAMLEEEHRRASDPVGRPVWRTGEATSRERPVLESHWADDSAEGQMLKPRPTAANARCSSEYFRRRSPSRQERAIDSLSGTKHVSKSRIRRPCLVTPHGQTN